MKAVQGLPEKQFAVNNAVDAKLFRLVLMPLHGHTAGQVGLFLALPSGKRFFFIGDTTWTLEACNGPRAARG